MELHALRREIAQGIAHVGVDDTDHIACLPISRAKHMDRAIAALNTYAASSSVNNASALGVLAGVSITTSHQAPRRYSIASVTG
jgi:hypothetical protein